MALYWWRTAARRSWRQAAVLAVLVGLLGAVALAALGGARRTATAYGRYLAASNVSDATRSGWSAVRQRLIRLPSA